MAPRRGLSLLLLAAGALCLVCPPILASQTTEPQNSHQSQPLMGQGVPPEEPVSVYVSALLQRMLDIDDRNYRFENVMYLYLSWEDSRAMGARANATQAIKDGSKSNCTTWCGNSGSRLDQDTAGLTEFCCDGVWLPTANIRNVYALPLAATQESEIVIEGDRVGWFTAIHCVYFTPMNFKAFPFDRQELVMQFRSPSTKIDAMPVSDFVPSATSTRWMMQGGEDIVAGWAVKSLEVEPVAYSLQEMLDYSTSNFGTGSSLEDPLPISMHGAECVHYFENETITGFDVTIKVERFSQYYVTDVFVPILLLTLLSIITYTVPPVPFLDARIALNVTVFLALAVLQLSHVIVNDQLTAYSRHPTKVTQFIIVCYVVVALGIPESAFVYALQQRADKMQAKTDSEADKSSSRDDLEAAEPQEGQTKKARKPSSTRLLSQRLLSLHSERPRTLAKWIDRIMMVAMVLVVVITLIVLRTSSIV